MKKIYLALTLIGLVVGFTPEAWATVTFSVLSSLGANATGTNPNYVTLGADGNFYGTTADGGANNVGVVFKLTPGGTLTDLHDFAGGTAAAGCNPNSNLVQTSNGTLYGTTNYGGANDYGVFFSITTTGTYTILHTFNDGVTAITAPTLLYLNSDGNFYGIGTFGGGGTDAGALVKLTPAGAYSVVYAFNGTTNGAYPNPQLVLGGDGAYYGTTPQGGANGDGTIFRVTTAGQFSVLSNVGANETPILTALGSDGTIYGYDDYANTVFKLTNGGVETVVYTFMDGMDGRLPNSLITGTDGNLYGLSTYYGANGNGTFFEITSGGTFSTLEALPVHGSVGALIQGSGSTFYATGGYGGTGTGGQVVQLTTSGADTVIYSFITPGSYPYAALLQASDGNLYGTTEFGGATGDGTVFQMTTTGTYSSLADLTFATTGSKPESPLIQDPTTGDIFGTATTGGPDYDSGLNMGGAVFSFVLPGTSGNAGIRPADAHVLLEDRTVLTPETLFYIQCLAQFGILAPLIVQTIHPNSVYDSVMARSAVEPASTGNTPQLFGVCAYGGDNNDGVFFDFQPDGTANTAYSFGDQSTDGVNPESPVVHDANGNFYGTTAYGGTGAGGTIYEISPVSGSADSTLTTIHNFATATGITPGNSNLVVGTDGNVYGTTQAGGTYGAGVVFQITPAGVYTVLHSFNPQSGSDGGTPMAGLIQASDGNFYGTTSAGGDNTVGTVFSITPQGAVTIIHSFGGADGAQPFGALIQGTDGNLYGDTYNGGVLHGSNTGVIFKIDAGLPPPTVTTAPQTITFPVIARQQYSGSPVTLTLNATASSGQSVSFTYVSGHATLSGTNNATVTLTGTGTVTIQANQAGNSQYLPAPGVSQSFTVSTPVAFSGTAAATPKGDSVPDLLKYLYDINPLEYMTAADRAALPVVSIDKTSNPGMQYLALTYRKNALETGITINFQTSSNLQTWTTLANPDISQQVGVDPTTGDPILEMGVTVNSSIQQFIRLRVTQP